MCKGPKPPKTICVRKPAKLSYNNQREGQLNMCQEKQESVYVCWPHNAGLWDTFRLLIIVLREEEINERFLRRCEVLSDFDL